MNPEPPLARLQMEHQPRRPGYARRHVAKPKTMTTKDGFLADGYERAYDANEPVVRAEVQSEYAERLAKALSSERERIRNEMEVVIAERLEKLAPPDAHY